MEVINSLEVQEQKNLRRKKNASITESVHGHCAHVGQISKGCVSCFFPTIAMGADIGKECQCSCPMCFYPHKQTDDLSDLNVFIQRTSELHAAIYKPELAPDTFCFRSAGEPLLYMDEIKEFIDIFDKIKVKHGHHVYKHLYTNGILATKKVLTTLKDWGIDELRFHVTASLYSPHNQKNVFDNLELASKMGFITTVEEPSWPGHADLLKSYLPIFNDLGLVHLNLTEVRVTPWNKERIIASSTKVPARIYKDGVWFLYDNGLVYDIMDQVADNGFCFSVLDCNSSVEKYRFFRNIDCNYDLSMITPDVFRL